MIYHIKFREKGRKSWLFLTSGGGGNRLRIHAARFDSLEKAQRVIDDNAGDNPDFDMKVAQ